MYLKKEFYRVFDMKQGKSGCGRKSVEKAWKWYESLEFLKVNKPETNW
jgi:hypothetical protein